MNGKDLMDMAVRNLWKRKVRTLLTVLGVVIGTASIVVMVSIGIGMNKGFEQQLEGWGSLQVINVYPGGGMSYDEATGEMKQEMKEAELNAKAVESFKVLEHVEAASPLISEYLYFSVGKYVADASVIGIDPAAMESLGYKVEEGRTLQEGDGKVLVFGGGVDFYDPKLSWEARYTSDPPEIDILKEKIKVSYDWNYGTRYEDKSIKPIKMDAVGKTSAQGSDSWSVFMPIQELEKIQKERQKWENQQNGGGSIKNQSKEFDEVLVKVDEMENVQDVQKQITDMGFHASSLTDELKSMQETTKMLRLVLGAIGAISMLVAAISITNTMVMSIYERTKEIGVMKVIGASLTDIKRLFLTEAACIGFMGGIFGILFSYLLSFIINIIVERQGSTMQSYIPIWLGIGAVAFATAVGVTAGYIPAKRAMRLSALTAIKTE